MHEQMSALYGAEQDRTVRSRHGVQRSWPGQHTMGLPVRAQLLMPEKVGPAQGGMGAPGGEGGLGCPGGVRVGQEP